MLAELRSGMRQLQRRKTASATIILLMAVSVGANTIVFTLIDQLLVKPLPVRDPQGLFLFEKLFGSEYRDHSFTYVEFQQVIQRKDLFTSAVAEQTFGTWNVVRLDVEGGIHGRLVSTQVVSPDYFSDLGVSPVIGRLLQQSDPDLSEIPVVLSYQFWQAEFGGVRDIVGRTIRLKNYPFTVVGVVPEEFHGIDVDHAPDVRLPISATPLLMGYAVGDSAVSGPANFTVLGRLARNVTSLQAASAIVKQVIDATEAAWTLWNSKQATPMSQDSLRAALRSMVNYRVALSPCRSGRSQLRTDVAQPLKLLMTTAVLLFLVVCANIAGLLSATLEERRKELAIRLSLGATRGAVVKQQIIESVVLGIPGILGGIGMALALSPIVERFLSGMGGPDIDSGPRLFLITPDFRVGMFVFVISAVIVSVFALNGVRLSGKVDLNSELKGNLGRLRQHLLQPILVSLQVAFALVLLYAGALMIRTFVNLQHVGLGFDPSKVIEVTLDPSKAGYSEPQTGAFARNLLQEVDELDFVHSAAYAAAGLMRGRGLKTVMTPVGTSLTPDVVANTSVNFVSADYFETLGIPLTFGHPFTDYDADKKPLPVVVNRVLADMWFPHENALGKMLIAGTDGKRRPDAVIVGVVGASKYRSVREEDPPTYYAPWSYNNIQTPLLLYVRGTGTQHDMMNAIRNRVSQFAKAVPVTRIVDLEQQIHDSLWQERLMAWLSLFFGSVAVAVASLGIYGLFAYAVKRRSRELAVRIALGSSIRRIVMDLSGRYAAYLAGGLSLGTIVAVLIVRLARHFIFGVAPLDISSLVVSLFAVVLPASVIVVLTGRKAWSRDPAAVLHEE